MRREMELHLAFGALLANDSTIKAAKAKNAKELENFCVFKPFLCV